MSSAGKKLAPHKVLFWLPDIFSTCLLYHTFLLHNFVKQKVNNKTLLTFWRGMINEFKNSIPFNYSTNSPSCLGKNRSKANVAFRYLCFIPIFWKLARLYKCSKHPSPFKLPYSIGLCQVLLKYHVSWNLEGTPLDMSSKIL